MSLILAFLTLLNVWSMESDNPFYEDLGPEDGPFDLYEEINDADRQLYPLHEVNFKFTQPEKITYFDHPASFVGFDKDDEDRVTVMLLYIDDHEAVLKDIEDVFGEPDLTLNIGGQAEFKDGDHGNMTYASNIWVRGKYRLSYALYPFNNPESGSAQMKCRVLIKEH